MNNLPTTNGIPGLIRTIRFPDFDVTWAGAHPLQEGFCFGSEKGELLITDESGNPLGKPGKAIASDEAINGVAGVDGWIAVSTRTDVNFLQPQKGNNGSVQGLQAPVGAHDVIAT